MIRGLFLGWRRRRRDAPTKRALCPQFIGRQTIYFDQMLPSVIGGGPLDFWDATDKVVATHAWSERPCATTVPTVPKGEQSAYFTRI